MTLDPFQLTERKILVAGATSGIGAACCLAIAARGGSLLATGRRADRLEHLMRQLKEGSSVSHNSAVCDLTKSEARDQLLPHGPFDGLVYAAGKVELRPVAALTESILREHMLINYEAAVLLTQGLLRAKMLRGGSSLVYISSIMAMVSSAGNGAYTGTKGALSAFVRTLALEVAPRKIRANCICPAMVRSGMADYTATALSSDAMKRHEAEYALGFGEPEDVANVVVFLLSPASRWMTGVNLVLDGGLTLR